MGLAPEDRTGPVINDHRWRPVALGRLCGKPHEAEVSLASEKSGLEIGQFTESAVEKIWEFSQFCEWLNLPGHNIWTLHTTCVSSGVFCFNVDVSKMLMSTFPASFLDGNLTEKNLLA